MYIHVTDNLNTCENNGMERITSPEECLLAAGHLGYSAGSGFTSDWSRSNVFGGCIYEVDSHDVDFNSNLGSNSVHDDRQAICKQAFDAVTYKILVEEGTCAEFGFETVTLQQCAVIAYEMGLPAPTTEAESSWPPGCYEFSSAGERELWYNTYESSDAHCISVDGSHTRRCICRAQTCENTQAVVVWEDGNQIHASGYSTFGPWYEVVDSPAMLTDPLEGCTELQNDLTGYIAVVQRGTCWFSTKIRNAQNAGAKAVIILNNGNPDVWNGMACGGSDDCSDIVIPAVFLPNDSVNSFKQILESDPDHIFHIGCSGNYIDPTSGPGSGTTSQPTTGVNYIPLESAGTCEDFGYQFASLEQCYTIAFELGAVTVHTEYEAAWPTGCYEFMQGTERSVWFNNNFDSGAHCQSNDMSHERRCLCIEGSCHPSDAIVVWDEGNQVHAAGESVFGSWQEVVDVRAMFSDPIDGCTPIRSDFSGHIAVMKRGSCNFGTKVYNAQLKNALGVIILNDGTQSDPSDTETDCGDHCDNIDIPAVFLPTGPAESFEETLTNDPGHIIHIACAGFYPETSYMGTTAFETTQGVTECVCPEIYSPVCGADGQTYSSECHLTCAGVAKASEGACSEQECEDTNGDLTDAYGLSCGHYHNWESMCGIYDTSDFNAIVMCCACGGGSKTSSQRIKLITGECLYSDNCISSAGYPDENHGNNEYCEFEVLQDSVVSTSEDFYVEGNGYDFFTIRGEQISQSIDLPSEMEKGEKFTWESDYVDNYDRWRICFSDGTSVSDLFYMHGDCEIHDDCVASNGYPRVHGDNEACTVILLQDVSVAMEGFDIEVGFDTFTVAGNDYTSVDNIPSTLRVGDAVLWKTDEAVSHTGWKMCFEQTVLPPGTPQNEGVSQYFIVHGDCELVGECVQSQNFPAAHGHSADCTFVIREDTSLVVNAYDVEGHPWDYLTYNDKIVEAQSDIPNTVNAGESFTWKSDTTDQHTGWQICHVGSGEHGSDFFTATGDGCSVAGDCVSSINFPNSYTLNTECTVEMKIPGAATASQANWNLAAGDALTVYGNSETTNVQAYSQFPTYLHAGEQIEWRANGQAPSSGWQVCFRHESVYFEMTGDCDQVGDCVSSKNYPSNYGKDESCYVEILQHSNIDVIGGSISVLDYLYINQVVTYASQVPEHVLTGQIITWVTDEVDESSGWKFCFSGHMDSLFTVSGDGCVADGQCVETAGYPGTYQGSCSVTMQSDVTVAVEEIGIGYYSDLLEIPQGNWIQASSSIPNQLNNGDIWIWETRSPALLQNAFGYDGWRICFTEREPAAEPELFEVTGDCPYDYETGCVSTPNFPDEHDFEESCSIRVTTDVTVTPDDTFGIEVGYDHLVIQNHAVNSIDEVPADLKKGDWITWSSDESVSDKGWKLCMEEKTDHWYHFTNSGTCESNGHGMATPTDCYTFAHGPTYTIPYDGDVNDENMVPGCSYQPGPDGYAEKVFYNDVRGLTECNDGKICICSVGTCHATDAAVIFDDGNQIHMTTHAEFGPWHEVLDTKAMMTNPSDACDPINIDMRGLIAVADRGGCTFVTKARHAQDVHAVALLILNHGGGDAGLMVCPDDDDCSDIRIPVLFIYNESVDRFRNMLQNDPDHIYHLSCSGFETETENPLFHVSGHCDVNDNCVSASGYPTDYETGVWCQIDIKQDVTVTLSDPFMIELGWDYLYIDGMNIMEPANVPATLAPRDRINWWSDNYQPYPMAGFELCFGGEEPEFFTIVEGPCEITGETNNCVSSSNYPNGYTLHESCEIHVNRDAYIQLSPTFEIDYDKDYLSVGDEVLHADSYYYEHDAHKSFGTIPKSLNAGQLIGWSSHGDEPLVGWEICFFDEDPDRQETDFFLANGDCDVVNNCVSSNNWPEEHYDNDECHILVLKHAILTPTGEFEIEQYFDILTIAGTVVNHEDEVPENINTGDEITWTSDGSQTSTGWQICFSEDTAVNFIVIESSGTCIDNGYGRVNMEQCAIIAEEMGSPAPIEESEPDWPTGCYEYDQGGLRYVYYNTYAGSEADCMNNDGSHERRCLCKAGTCNSFEAVVVWDDENEIHATGHSEFGNWYEVIDAPAMMSDPLDGCTEITNDLSGHVAVIQRGTCYFSDKARNAQAAGALGVIILNNGGGDVSVMVCGDDVGNCEDITIPLVFLQNESVDSFTNMLANDPGHIIHLGCEGNYNAETTAAPTQEEVNYIVLESDGSCVDNGYGSVTQEQCSIIAYEMGSPAPITESVSDWPAGCYEYDQGGERYVYYNLDHDSDAICMNDDGSHERRCLCNAGTCNAFDAVVVWDDENQIHATGHSEFGNWYEVIDAPAMMSNPLDGCTEITNDLSGHVAVIRRGTCYFSEKARNAQAAGALGVIILNNGGDDNVIMVCGDDVGNCEDITIPLVFLPNEPANSFQEMLANDPGHMVHLGCEGNYNTAVNYIVLDSEGSCTDNGYGSVTQDQCSIIAEEMGSPAPITEAVADWPAGCYEYDQEGVRYVYYNMYHDSEADCTNDDGTHERRCLCNVGTCNAFDAVVVWDDENQIHATGHSEFGHWYEVIDAPAMMSNPLDGCTEITTDLSGHVAVIQRGTCYFSDKARNAQAAGALGVIILNNGGDDNVIMICGDDDGNCEDIRIPLVFLPNEPANNFQEMLANDPGHMVHLGCEGNYNTPESTQAPGVNYIVLESSGSCTDNGHGSVSMEECSIIASEMGSPAPITEVVPNWPAGCYEYDQGGERYVYYNMYHDSDAHCMNLDNSHERRCLCKVGTCNSFDAVVVWDDENQIHATGHSEFGNWYEVIDAPAMMSDPLDGCETIRNDLSGHVAVIQRGTCFFSDKVRNAQAAGALGVIILNNGGDDNVIMICGDDDGNCEDITIPLVFLPNESANSFQQILANDPGHIIHLGCQGNYNTPQTTQPPGDLFTITGQCGQQDNCVSSGNYPGIHGSNELCVVTLLQDVFVTTGDIFHIEEDYDILQIPQNNYVESRAQVPAELKEGDQIMWSSDSSVNGFGWQICFQYDAPPASTAIPTVFSTDQFYYSGDCDHSRNALGQYCVSSTDYPNFHGHNEKCTVTVTETSSITLDPNFFVEDYDKLIIDFFQITNDNHNEPNMWPQLVKEGTTINWRADEIGQFVGWQICFDEITVPLYDIFNSGGCNIHFTQHECESIAHDMGYAFFVDSGADLNYAAGCTLFHLEDTEPQVWYNPTNTPNLAADCSTTDECICPIDATTCTGEAFSVYVETHEHANEISWMIPGSRCSGALGSYEPYQRYVGHCCLPEGQHTVNCKDSFGDGWHDNVLKIGDVLLCYGSHWHYEKSVAINVENSVITKVVECDAASVEITFQPQLSADHLAWAIQGGTQLCDSQHEDYENFGSYQKTCCVTPDTTYTLVCENTREHLGWRGGSITVGDQTFCADFLSGQIQLESIYVNADGEVGPPINPTTTTLPSDCPAGETNIAIILETGLYGYEVSWNIQGLDDTHETTGVVCGSPEGESYDSGDSIESFCCLPNGLFQINCVDSFGDGWNSAHIYLNGDIYCATFGTGDHFDHKVTHTDGTIEELDLVSCGASEDKLDIVMTSTTSGYSAGWEILDQDENVVCTKPDGMAYPDDVSVTHKCCLDDGVYTLKCTSSSFLGWNGGFITVDGVTFCDDIYDASAREVNFQYNTFTKEVVSVTTTTTLPACTKPLTWVNVVTSDFGDEMTWFITEDCTGDEMYNYQEYMTPCCLDDGDYVVRCIDTWGDGWGRNASITVGDEVFCNDFYTGALEEHRISVTNGEVSTPERGCGGQGDYIDIVLHTKSFGHEVSWTITSACRTNIRYDPDSVYETYCCIPPDSVLTCSDLYGDGWHGGYIEINGRKFCEDFTDGMQVTHALNPSDLTPRPTNEPTTSTTTTTMNPCDFGEDGITCQIVDLIQASIMFVDLTIEQFLQNAEYIKQKAAESLNTDLGITPGDLEWGEPSLNGRRRLSAFQVPLFTEVKQGKSVASTVAALEDSKFKNDIHDALTALEGISRTLGITVTVNPDPIIGSWPITIDFIGVMGTAVDNQKHLIVAETMDFCQAVGSVYKTIIQGQFSTQITRLRFDLTGDANLMSEQVDSCEKILVLNQKIQNLPWLANAHILNFETADRLLQCYTTTTTGTPTKDPTTTKTPTKDPTTTKTPTKDPTTTKTPTKDPTTTTKDPTTTTKDSTTTTKASATPKPTSVASTTIPSKAPSSAADSREVIDKKSDDDGVKASHMEYLVIGLLSALILVVCCGALYMLRRNQVIKAQVQSVQQRETTEMQSFGMTETYMTDSYATGGATYRAKKVTKPDTSLRTVQTIYPIDKRQPMSSETKRAPHSKLEAGLYGDITPRGPAGFNSLTQRPNEGKGREAPKTKKATTGGNIGGTKAPEDDYYEGDLVTM